MRAFHTALLLTVPCACAVTPYQPLPVEVPGGLPPDAWDRVRGLLLQRYGGLALADEDGFRLQTPWVPMATGDQPAEQRATVFRQAEDRLAVVVEVRFLRFPTWGTPGWGPVQGDAQRERELADALAAVLHGRAGSEY